MGEFLQEPTTHELRDRKAHFRQLGSIARAELATSKDANRMVLKRVLDDRLVQASALDLILVPGVAFDRKGGRFGFGKGYCDRLLARIRGDAIKIGLAFECQMFDAVPVGPHDVQMDLVVTESGVCDCIAERANR